MNRLREIFICCGGRGNVVNENVRNIEKNKKSKKLIKIWAENTIINFKETIKFVIISMLVYLSIGFPLIYIFVEKLKFRYDMAGLIIGIICVIIIVIIDHKKTHHLLRIIENHKKFMDIVEEKI